MNGFPRFTDEATCMRWLDQIAEDLASALDEIVFTIEHGVPGEVLTRLGEIVARLEAVEMADPSHAVRLHRAAVDLDEAKRGMWRVDPAAAEHVLRRGRGIVEVLRNRNPVSGA